MAYEDHPMKGILTDEQIAESIRLGNELADKERDGRTHE